MSQETNQTESAKNPDQAKAGGERAQGPSTEAVVAQWRRERPDIDSSVMAVCGEVWRAGERLRRGVLANLARYDLDMPGFDVLLTLRRQGKGQALSPTALADQMMRSTSAMTNRLDRLEKRGLISRATDPADRRGLKIALTAAGFALADEAVVSHVDTEESLLKGLNKKERAQLKVLLAKVAE